jgi:nucleotide-binding universal stress UspA family protein
VLLAIDFGSASLSAARWGTTHVAPDADAILMHVMPFAGRRGDTTQPAPDDSVQRMTPAVAGGLGGFAATLNVASARSLVRVGQPSGSLAAVANDAEVSLMVLGRRADANRVRVGEPNVIERAVRRTSASVLVVPEGTVHGPDHVFAAVDESRFAPQVLEVASRLARMHEVPLVILHVLSPVAGAYERVMRSAKHQLSRVGGLKRSAAARPARPAPLSLATTRWLIRLGQAHNVLGRDSTEVAVGDPAREITSMAMKRESPLVVVGLRGADDAPPGSIGSVARELLTRGPMPVLAVNVL